MGKKNTKIASNSPSECQSKDDETAGGGLDDIDSLFAKKKDLKREQQERIRQAEEEQQRQKEQKRQLSIPIGGGSSVSASKGKKSKLLGDRTDTQGVGSGDWVDDGLGGVFNADGFTGRRDESGAKVFKAHLFNKKGFGTSKECPFDCDCCFI
jgi:hypothetical protein